MKIVKYILPLVLLAGANNVLAADLDGEKLFNTKTCAACHGAAGAKPIMDSYPKLNGQSAAYLVIKLKGYKAGEMKGGQAALMTPMGGMVNEEEIEAIAKYLSEVVIEKE